MSKVLITGGAGFVGSYVVRRLVADHHEVAIYDSFESYRSPDLLRQQPNLALRLSPVAGKIRLIRGNTTNKDFMRRQLVAFRPDFIIHLAAVPFVELASGQSEEAFRSIVASTQSLLDIMYDFDWPCRLTFASSSMVYGNFLTEPVAEDHPKAPTNLYGAFKLAGEIIVNAHGANYKVGTVVVRPSAVYGPLGANNTVIEKWIRLALAGEALPIVGDGSLRMDFTYVEDTAEGIVACALHPDARGEAFNITRGEARSLAKLVQVLRAHFPNLKTETRPMSANIPTRGTLSIGKARRIVDFEPKISLEEGVDRYVTHLRANSY